MKRQQIAQIVYYFCQWLWLFIPYISSKDGWKKTGIRLLLSIGTVLLLALLSLKLTVYLQEFNDLLNASLFSNFYIGYYKIKEYVLSTVTIVLEFCIVLLYFRISEGEEWKDSLYQAGMNRMFAGSAEMARLFITYTFFDFHEYLYRLPDPVLYYIPLSTVITGIVLLMLLERNEFRLESKDRDALTWIVLFFAYCVAKLIPVFKDNTDYMLGLTNAVLPVLFIYLLKNRIMLTQYKYREAGIKKQIAILDGELGAIHGYTEQISETRHTLLHHMNNLQKFIEQEDTKGAEIYIHSIMNEYSREEINYCENVYVNAVLNYYADRYPEVSLDVKATIGSDCMIRPMDIGLLVFVIMEEAVTEGNKAINLRIAQIEDTVVITFKDIAIQYNQSEQLKTEDLLPEYDIFYNHDPAKKTIVISMNQRSAETAVLQTA